MRRSLGFGLAAAVLGVLAWCGCAEYQSQGNFPDHIKKIAIPTFINKTTQPGLEQDLTQRVVQNFIVDGRLSVASQDQADALLQGEIQQYAKLPLLRDSNQVPIQYKLQVVLDITFTDLKPQGTSAAKVLWTTKRLVDLTPTPAPISGNYDSTNTSSLSEFRTFYVNNNMGAAPEDENVVLTNILEQLARDVVSRTIDGE